MKIIKRTAEKSVLGRIRNDEYAAEKIPMRSRRDVDQNGMNTEGTGEF